jgi:hypothetical protein
MSSGSSSSNTTQSKPAPGLQSRGSQPGQRQSASSILPVAPRPLLLTVRFSAAVPDLQLDIPRPGSTTVVALKHLIRSRLDGPDATRRLRFIHGGKILPDTALLSDVLRPPPPPPSNLQDGKSKTSDGAAKGSAADGSGQDSKGKGKAIDGQPALQRVYVNCSIGDVLSDSDLAAEKHLAEQPVSGNASTISPTNGLRQTAAGRSASAEGTSATTRAPRGFDRLLNAGFTVAEVNQLRLQFRSIHAARHTPDTMPSPDSLRSMEDSWIDNNSSAGLGGAGSGLGDDGTGDIATAGGADADAFGGISVLLDVMLRGMTIGFLWPLGSAGWLVREEGMWSRRWQVFVSLGCILSLTIGMIRVVSGDK